MRFYVLLAGLVTAITLACVTARDGDFDAAEDYVDASDSGSEGDTTDYDSDAPAAPTLRRRGYAPAVDGRGLEHDGAPPQDEHSVRRHGHRAGGRPLHALARRAPRPPGRGPRLARPIFFLQNAAGC